MKLGRVVGALASVAVGMSEVILYIEGRSIRLA